jgi:histidine triad (HIT) family protein
MPDKEITEDDLKNMSAEEIAELQKQNCIFCKIANKEIPSKIVHEDADTICVLDINPAAEGHILVFPKKHYMILPHIPDDVLAKIFKSVKLMSHTLLKSLQCGGTTVFVANGVAAGQKAPHALIHVFPRRENDGLVPLPKYEMSEEQIAKLSAQLGMYTGQVFGRRKPIVKDAEFTEKHHTDGEPIHHKKEDRENDVKKETENHDMEEYSDEDKKNDELLNEKKNKKSDKETKDKHPAKKDSKNTKVDLDDIARLFG